MTTLKIDMKMNNPNEDVAFWQNVLNTFSVISPWAAGAWGFHKVVNAVFKYFSDSRDAELRKLISNEVNPRFDRLDEKIDKIIRNQK